MYSRIMVPVDLAHEATLEKSLETAADLARHYGASVVFLGITTPEPGTVAHSPEEYAAKLDAFAARQVQARGIDAKARAVIVHDPAVEMSDRLIEAVALTGADLVVMASHVPGLAEHLFASHGGYVASHAGVSVMLVR